MITIQATTSMVLGWPKSSHFLAVSLSATTSSKKLLRQSNRTIVRCGASASMSNYNEPSEIASVPTDNPNQQQQSSGNYFLLKSEPHEFSIQDLKLKGREEWDGVRNYAARNHLRSMRVADVCWFYHSSCASPAIVGTCRVVREARPDQTALDPQHDNYDAKSTSEKCRWDSVLVEFDSLYETPVTLKELKYQAKQNMPIADMLLLKQSRLSVMPITKQQWEAVEHLIERKERGENLLK